jgi:Fur family transcriptional regulator, ferric uptake regulator
LITIIAKLRDMSPSGRQRSTTQGSAVRDALLEQSGFRSAQDIYATMRAGGRAVGLSTVYRHLQSFVDQGLADVIHTPDGETTYRYCGGSARKGHHHHLVCRSCGRAEEVEGRAVERWAAGVAEKHGYVDVDHTVEVFGVCADCAANGAGAARS